MPGWSDMLRGLCLVFAAWLWLGAPVAAQPSSEQQSYYDRWVVTADRAEEVIDANRASNAAFEALRRQLVEFREGFLAARDRNAARILTVQSQLDALGPAPEEGQIEPEEVALIRDRLTAELTQYRVPVVVSQEAFNRANGLIAEIDRIIRERETERLLTRWVSPLNPTYWWPTVDALARAFERLADETVASARTARQNGTVRGQLPVVLILTGLGALFLFRGVRWADLVDARLRRLSRRGVPVWEFIASLGRIALPLLGTIFLVAALSVSGVLGLRGELVVQALPFWAMILLGCNGLALEVFPTEGLALVPIKTDNHGRARWVFRMAGLVLVLHDIVLLIEEIENISDTSQSVMGFPAIVLGAYVLLRVSQLMVSDDPPSSDEDQNKPMSGLLLFNTAIRWLSFVACIAGTLLAAIGYHALAELLVFPSIMTFLLFNLVLVLQAFLTNVYAWVSSTGESAADSVIPALAGILLAFASLPFFAMIWGAQVADLTKLWSRFLEGFQIGETTISPVNILTFLIIFAVGYAATRVFRNALGNSLLPRTRMDPGARNAIVSGTGYLGIFLAALIAITTAGIDLSSLAIVAGALSVGIGFGLQMIVQNFVSGIILLIERPISEGDWIEVNGQMGYVRQISVRSTVIETFDRRDVIVPNADFISGTVINYTRGNTVGRLIVPIGVAYGNDTRRVEAILRDIAEAHPMVLASPPPSIVFQGFGADSLNFEIRAILRDVNWMLSVQTHINHSIAERFRDEGIEIPFAQRDVWLRNPEALATGQDSGRPANPPETETS